MPRNMSFMLTTRQVEDESKDVTRRDGWWFLKPGDRLWAVEKAMGLKKGEKVKRLKLIEVVSTRAEQLDAIDGDDVKREGFPDWKPIDFIWFYRYHNGGWVDQIVNRIEFKYVKDPA